MNELSAVFLRLPTALMTFALGLCALIVGKFFYILSTPRRQGPDGMFTHMFHGNNIALSVSICGFLASLGIALNCGVVMGTDQWSVSMVILGSLISILLLKISMLSNDRAIMGGIDNDKEIMGGNLAVAIVETGGLLATGFMLRGVLMSNSASLMDKFIDIGAYWVIGQVLFVLGAAIYKLIFPTTSELLKSNLAVAFRFAGFLVAYGMIIEASLTGATSNIVGEIPAIVIFSLVGLALLLLINKFVNVLFLEASEKNASENVGPSLIIASILIALGFVFSGVIDTSITKPAEPDAVVKRQSVDETLISVSDR